MRIQNMKKRAVFFKQSFNVCINVLFMEFLILIFYGIFRLIFMFVCKIPNLDNYIGTIISVTVTVMIAITSYLTKIKNFFQKVLYKLKQRIYILLSLRYNYFLSQLIENYNINNLFVTTEQIEIINSAIDVLKNNKQNTILISSFPGKGKTTSLMLLLDTIAHDKELYKLFIELQHRIIYFDSVNDCEQLEYYLCHPEKQANNIVIIDNIQKHSIIMLNTIMERIHTMVMYAKQDEKKILFVLLYQQTKYNIVTYEQIKYRFFNENVFTLNQDFKHIRKSTKKKRRLVINDLRNNILDLHDSSFKRYLENILYNARNDSFIKFMNKLLFVLDLGYPIKDEKKIYVLSSIIFWGYYYGYVSQKAIIAIWKKRYKFSWQGKFILNFYVRNHVLTPFPFIRNAYLFNEHLAKEYRKYLVKNRYLLATFHSIAENIFLTCNNNFISMKWLFFISCSPEFCMEYPQEDRILFFEIALNTYHLKYILDVIETEISILPEKKSIFRQELGIIYIRNGEWKKAKDILYPYISEHNINKDIWQIQLKIIEAEHGCSDEDNLEMLDCMENECTDFIILFQIRYWREHILMEHGKFSLDAWEELIAELKSSNELLLLQKDEYFSTRIISDYERTYFLKGNIEYSIYRLIFEQYSFFNQHNTMPLEQILSRAYYIQYDILYQLGIWGYAEYSNIEPDIIGDFDISEYGDIIKSLVMQANDIYNICINKYQSAGKKKYRTLQMRRAELSLCIDSGQHMNVLSKFDEFENYARENNITVFEGYCHTQKGKAFALYADSEFRKGHLDKSKEFLKKAEKHFRQAENVYHQYGNTYGELRAVFLTILVDMIRKRDCTDSVIFRERFKQKFTKLQTDYHIKQNYFREQNIIMYLEDNLSSITIPIDIIRYYPIILQ